MFSNPKFKLKTRLKLDFQDLVCWVDQVCYILPNNFCQILFKIVYILYLLYNKTLLYFNTARLQTCIVFFVGFSGFNKRHCNTIKFAYSYIHQRLKEN